MKTLKALRDTTRLMNFVVPAFAVLIAGCSTPPSPQPLKIDWQLEWYHLADMQCLCQNGDKDDLAKALNSLSLTELEAVIEDGDRFIDLVRQIADSLVDVPAKKTFLELAEAYRKWRPQQDWPSDFEFRFAKRGTGFTTSDRIVVDKFGAYLLLPFEWDNPNSETDALQTKITNLWPNLDIPTLTYDSTVHVQASRVLQNVDESIYTDITTHQEAYRQCEVNHAGPDQADARSTCIKGVINDYSAANHAAGTDFAGPFQYPVEVDFRFQDAMFLVDTNIHSTVDQAQNISNMIVNIGFKHTFVSGVVDWPCGHV